MSPLAFYRQMIASGMDEATAYNIAAQFEAEESAKAEQRYNDLLNRLATPTDKAASKRREWDRQRKAEERAAKKAASGGHQVESAGPRVDQVDIRQTQDARAPVHTRGEDNLPRLVDTSSGVGVGVVGVGAREPDQQSDDWPKGDHVKLLVEAVASPWLDPVKSPNLITTAGRLAAWKRDGASWEHDVLPVVRGLCANRRSRVDGWKFFDAAIGRSIADNRAALEIPEAVTRRPGTGPPRMSFAEQAGADAAAAKSLALKGLAANG